MLSTTAGCSHISVCIAGQIITGARVASSTLVSRSVDRPIRYEAISRAVAGATSTRSALWPSVVCGIGVSGSSQRRVLTGSLASADSVAAPRKRSAPLVITGITCAPASTSRRVISTALYAAIPPVTPRTIRLPAIIAAIRCQPASSEPDTAAPPVGRSRASTSLTSGASVLTILPTEISSKAMLSGLRAVDET